MPDLVTTIDTSISAHLQVARSETAAAAALFHQLHRGDHDGSGLHQGDWLDQIHELLLELDPSEPVLPECSFCNGRAECRFGDDVLTCTRCREHVFCGSWLELARLVERHGPHDRLADHIEDYMQGADTDPQPL
jgi:hypothetical protein